MERRLAFLEALVMAAGVLGAGDYLGAVRTASAQATVDPEVVFQSDVLERTPGAPNVHRVSFETCDTAGSYRIVVENGVEGSPRVSSGQILLNGVPVITTLAQLRKLLDVVQNNLHQAAQQQREAG